MKVRPAVVRDAPAMGLVMVEAWLSAHRGQMPETAWQKRVDEWTPEVSADAWARLLVEIGNEEVSRVVLLVAEEDAGELVALVLGTEAQDDPAASIAQIDALYVRPDRQGEGIGRLLLQTAARDLARMGFSTLHIGVLTANLPARAFYETMGGQEIGQRTADEEGIPLPETVYAWSDIAALAGGHGQH